MHGPSKKSAKLKIGTVAAPAAAVPEPEPEQEKTQEVELEQVLKPTAPWDQPRGCELACVTADAGQSFAAACSAGSEKDAMFTKLSIGRSYQAGCSVGDLIQGAMFARL